MSTRTTTYRLQVAETYEPARRGPTQYVVEAFVDALDRSVTLAGPFWTLDSARARLAELEAAVDRNGLIF